jgi:hypothetical protein
MNLQTQSERARLARQGAEQAISLALDGKWEEAVALNRSLLANSPNDVDAQNRLGKALLELGRFRDAREAYSRALEIDPVNSIAKRNLDRLSTIKDDEEPRRAEVSAKVAQELFIEEIGKTGTTVLQAVAPDTLAKLVAGDEVYLKADGNILNVENVLGELICHVEAKLSLRLVRLMQSGNRYAAAIKSVGDSEAQVIIKEVYRDPSQTKVSFPSKGAEGVRPYIKESLLRYDIDEDEEEEDEVDEEREDWDAEPETTESLSIASLKESIADETDDSYDDE